MNLPVSSISWSPANPVSRDLSSQFVNFLYSQSALFFIHQISPIPYHWYWIVVANDFLVNYTSHWLVNRPARTGLLLAGHQAGADRPFIGWSSGRQGPAFHWLVIRPARTGLSLAGHQAGKDQTLISWSSGRQGPAFPWLVIRPARTGLSLAGHQAGKDRPLISWSSGRQGPDSH